MVFTGPNRGPIRGPMRELTTAAALAATLVGCGSDPPEVDQPKISPPGFQVRSARPVPVAVTRALAVPLQAPASMAEPLALAPPVVVSSNGPDPLASYPPQDECAKLPGFAAFRDALFIAVRKRDAAALTALADPAVNLDFGGGSGTDEWRKRLESSPALWGELAELEGLGCAQDGGVVTMPWIFSRVPDAVDAYRAMLVTDKGVPLHIESAAEAKELAKLDWALVETVGTPEAGAFREVTSGTSRGFVEAAKLRAVLDYRLIADRQNGEWKVTAFVAGD